MYLYFILYLLIMSVVTYVMYAADKKKAIKKQYRTKESTLLTMSFIGGALGGLFAMYGKRHKNKKWYFNAVNFGGLVLHLIIIFILL